MTVTREAYKPHLCEACTTTLLSPPTNLRPMPAAPAKDPPGQDPSQPPAENGDTPRVLIFSGKGGVGKTTLAGATGLHTARSGKRTIIISIDVAHSLADAFDLTDELTQHARGKPFEVEKNLEIQEIDVQEEVFRHWKEVHRYFSVLFAESGMDDIVAEDLALIPGMEDVVALLFLNDYVQEKRHDVIILDLAPTGESLRFVSMPDTLDWYMRRVFRFERTLTRAARPLAKRISKVPLPEDSYFKEIERLWARMEGVDKVLNDPDQTTVRLVTNPERMVIKETQRAHLYFSLHGVVVDEILVNRILPAMDDTDTAPFFSKWYQTQQKNLDTIHNEFPDLPVTLVPLLDDEAVGAEQLARLAEKIYGTPEKGRDPARQQRHDPPYQVESGKDGNLLHVHLPHLDKKQLDLWVEREELILRVASQKHHLPLPRSLTRRQPSAARYEDGWLHVHFPPSEKTPADTDAPAQETDRHPDALQVGEKRGPTTLDENPKEEDRQERTS